MFSLILQTVIITQMLSTGEEGVQASYCISSNGSPRPVSTITSDPRPVFEARPVFKVQLVLVHPHYDELMVTLCVFHRNNKHVC